MKYVAAVIALIVLTGHFIYVTGGISGTGTGGEWAALEELRPSESRLELYLGSGDFWLGLSYALSSAFAVWCFGRILKLRRDAAITSAGGLTLSGILLASVCFFTGCCGSPMLPIYLGLFGPQFMSVTKPLTFVLTLLSIVVGLAWMLRTAPGKFARS